MHARSFRAVGVIAAGLMALVGTAAWAQTPSQPPAQGLPQFRQGGGVTGTVASVSSGSFVVTTRGGKSVTVHLTGATKVLGRRAAALTDFNAGDTVIVVGASAANGSVSARTVTDAAATAFAAHQGRGGLWAGRKGSVTVVGRLAAAPAGGNLTVALPAGSPLTVTVPSTARLFRVVSLSAGSVAVGARVLVRGTANPDQTLTATTVMVGGASSR